MMNKDFLKEVLTGDKALMQLKEVKRINVPLYDELSVVKVWPMMKDDEKVRRYFPAKLPKSRLPDREYFFNVVNTFHGDYLAELLQHANKQRNEA